MSVHNASINYNVYTTTAALMFLCVSISRSEVRTSMTDRFVNSTQLRSSADILTTAGTASCVVYTTYDRKLFYHVACSRTLGTVIG